MTTGPGMMTIVCTFSKTTNALFQTCCCNVVVHSQSQNILSRKINIQNIIVSNLNICVARIIKSWLHASLFMHHKTIDQCLKYKYSCFLSTVQH